MADSAHRGGPPPFEDAFSGDDVEQRVFGTILQTRDPATATAISERADCDPKTARKYLDWFADLGIVTRHDGRPVTYERNDSYFEWRRVDRLAVEHSMEDLERRVRELTERTAAYESEYDASSPAAVDAVAVARGREDQSIDEVYADLGEWATARRERALCERARRQLAGGAELERASG